MTDEIKRKIKQINSGTTPEGYSKRRWILYPNDWNYVKLNTCLSENKERNKDGVYTKDDVLSVSGERGVVNQIEFMGRSYAGESVLPYHVVETGDIVYTKSPLKQNPYGIIKLNKGNPGIVSTLYAVYHCCNPITAEYLNYFFEIDEYLNSYLFPLVKKGAKNDMKVNNEDVIKGEMALPPIDEQVKIVKILQQCDKVIELYEKELVELRKLKKIYLKKMFLQKGAKFPELRFEQFTEPWKQCKLGDVLTVGNGMDYKELGEGDIPVYGTGGYMLSVNKALSYEKDAIGIGRKGTIDKPYILKAPFWTVDTLFYCIPKEGCDLDFLFGIFQNINWKQKDESTGVPSLSKININSTKIAIPSLAEQQQIGACFRNLNNLIDLHMSKLEEKRKYKKSLMQLLLTGIVRVNV